MPALTASRYASVILHVLTEMQRDGVRTVGWLVHPANLASIAFSQVVFAEADETYLPEDRPYARFLLDL